MRRLRESLVKSVSIVGVPKPLEAIHQISAVERPEDKDYSFSRYAAYFRLAQVSCGKLRRKERETGVGNSMYEALR